MVAWADFRDASAGKRPSVANQLSENRYAEIRVHVTALLRASYQVSVVSKIGIYGP